MIFCERLLYLHVPKTAGMSVTEVLLRACPRPTYNTHPASEEPWNLEGVVEIDGVRHETLEEAAALVKTYGFELERFPVIFAVIRNPYDLEVSRFGFYRRAGASEARNRGHAHAVAGDFRAFALSADPHGGPHRSIERYFLHDGVQPRNLHIVRYEHLAADLRQVLRAAGIPFRVDDPPHFNASDHEPWKSYYDTETEAAVFARYQWLFDAGYYDRLDAPLPKKG